MKLVLTRDDGDTAIEVNETEEQMDGCSLTFHKRWGWVWCGRGKLTPVKILETCEGMHKAKVQKDDHLL